MLFRCVQISDGIHQPGRRIRESQKLYSVNIVYFSLGHGKDLRISHGKTEFVGIHNGDILEFSPFQEADIQGGQGKPALS